MNGKKAKMMRKAAKAVCEKTSTSLTNLYTVNKSRKCRSMRLIINGFDTGKLVPISVHGGSVELDKCFRSLYKHFKKEYRYA